MSHQDFLCQAYQEAVKSGFHSSPNPRVGAVLVKDNVVIAKGFHQKFGEAHAEVNCLKDIEDASDCILYCTLEPCCHNNKKTPPCTHLITEKKIKHVVIAGLDANPAVAGKGVKFLEDHGVKVEIIEHDSISLLNESFNYFINHQTPYFHLKWAQTIDGKIATKAKDSKWITNSESRKYSHQLRRMCDVIITSAGTIRYDDPKLTARDDADWEYIPHRLILTKSNADLKEFKIMQTPHVSILHIDDQKDLKSEILGWMKKHHFISAFVEGGQELTTSFIKENLYNRIHIFISPQIFGDAHSAIGDLNIDKVTKSLKLRNGTWKNFQEDLYFTVRKE